MIYEKTSYFSFRDVCDFSAHVQFHLGGGENRTPGPIWASNVVGQIGVTKSLTGGEPMSNGVGN